MLDPKEIQVSVLAMGIGTTVCLYYGALSDDPSQCSEKKHSWVQAVSDLMPLGDIASMIRTCDSLSRQTVSLRALLESGRKPGSPYARAKLKLPALVPALSAPPGTALRGLDVGRHHSGLFGYDLDVGRGSLDLPAMREALINARGAVMVGTSAGGDALYAIFAGPKAGSEEDYKAHWQAIADTLPEGAKAASAGESKNSNQLRFVAHDPTVWLAAAPVEPLAGTRPVTAQEPPAVIPTPGLATCLDEHAVDLDALMSFPPPDDYNQWLGWLGRLKALGFDPNEAETWCARGTKYHPGEATRRWEGLPKDDPEMARDILRGHAFKQHGWRQHIIQVASNSRLTLHANGSKNGVADLSLDYQGAMEVVSGKAARGLLEALERLGVGIRFNLRADKQEFDLGYGWAPPTDRSRERLREVVNARFATRNRNGDTVRLNFGKDAFKNALHALLYGLEEDPFRTWLESLDRWDGKERLDGWLGQVFVINRYQELGEWASRFMALGAVWRTYNPGCKLDELPVLIGAGGIGKSTAARWLLPPEHDEWFGELNVALDNKRRVEALQGRVIVELGDMAGASRAEREDLKSFITKVNDGTERLSYRADPEPLPRRCVFVGTSDAMTPLPDDDNLRRWVPVTIDSGQPATVREYLDDHREQLWAEAIYLYRQGVPARLPDDLKPMQKEATGQARSRDQALDDAVQAWIARDEPWGFTLSEAAEAIRMVDPGEAARLTGRDSRRLAAALTTAGYRKERRMKNGVREYRWYTVASIATIAPPNDG